MAEHKDPWAAAYRRHLARDGRLTSGPDLDSHRAPADNWARCRDCGVEAPHVRDLQHAPHCGRRARQAWRPCPCASNT